MRSTIRDVAREAGVSVSTVSRVLNDTCPVGPDKRKRVLAAVQKLHYTPDPAARSLLKRETGGLGVLVPSVSEEYFSEILTAIDRLTQENGYFLLISSSHRSADEFDSALRSMYRRVDGLVVTAPDQAGYDPEHPVLRDMPVVYVNTRVPNIEVDTLSVANYRGVYRMTEHLIASGHRRLAMLKGPEGVIDAEDRLRGFRAAVKDYELDPDQVVELQGHFTRRSGYEAMSKLLELDVLPTALLAANDLSALGAMRRLLEAGYSIPDDIAVSGFDDVKSARYATPPLSTVRAPIRELGELAIKRLIERLRGESTQRILRKELPVELVLRASTEGAPSRRSRSKSGEFSQHGV